jgi:peptide/nickel transport system permease protein
MMATLLLLAVASPFVAPYASDAVDLANRRAAPSASHWFGTDELGRDVLTRIAVGARISLAIGVGAALMSVGVGTVVGVLAGYFGRVADDLLMRVTDALLAVPRLPLLMVASAVLHPGVLWLIVLVALTGWMETARVVRADVLSLSAREFVHAARAIGASPWRVMRRHLLPAVLPTASVAATLAVGRSILLESTLSFFGVGVQPPAASWGNMLYQAQSTLSTEPWLAVFPGLFIFLTVLACNLGGESFARTPPSSSTR